MDLTKYSALTLKTIINTYKPDIKIQQNKETVRKYLIHLIKTDKDLKNLSADIFDIVESESTIKYKNELINKKNQMIEYIKNKKEIVIHKYILQPKYHHDACFFDKYTELTKQIDLIDSEFNVIIEGKKYILNPQHERWYWNNNFICMKDDMTKP